MFEQFAAEHGGEEIVLVREAVFLRVEMVDKAAKTFSRGGPGFAAVHAPWRPEIAAADFAISKKVLESGRNLHVRPHLQNAVLRPAAGRDFKRADQAGQMCANVIAPFFGIPGVSQD